MTTATPSSSDSDSSKKQNGEERLMVAVRIRPIKSDDTNRVLYAINKKVCLFLNILIMSSLFCNSK